MLDTKWEDSCTVHELFRDLKNTCDPVRREILYYTTNILIEFDILVKLVGIYKTFLKATYNLVKSIKVNIFV